MKAVTPIPTTWGLLTPLLILLFFSIQPSHSQSTTATFRNPVLWEDYPDLDVFRVNSTFYYSSSTFAYSPGAPVLTSPDLVNWTPITHSVPTLNFSPRYYLNGSGSAYVKGIWASTLRYWRRRDTFIWLGCIESSKTHVWTASGTKAGERKGGGADLRSEDFNWVSQGKPIDACYYDAGLLVDEDETGKGEDALYVAYGNPRISVAQLGVGGSGTAMTLSQTKSQVVYTPADGRTIEGARMYKVNGTYYIFVTRPADAEIVLRSSTGSPFGPYTARTLVDRIKGPLASAGYAHQGGIVDTEDGRWYYVAFLDAYPGGRIPVVAPMVWEGGWPRVVTDGKGEWASSYPYPVSGSGAVVGNKTTGGVWVDEFKGERLGPVWEWNHNPDGRRWKFDTPVAGGGLVLQTADVTSDLFAARNTLTRRIAGPRSAGAFRVDVAGMKDGDRAGAVLFRDRAAYIGVWKEGTSAKIVVVTGLTMAEGTWATSGRGTVAMTGPTLTGGEDLWLRIEADITPAFGTSTERTTTFAYSVDGGKTFVKLGPAVPMTNSWRYFTGYRFGVFNHATKELGGEVRVRNFTMTML